jgi:glycosyltransferase involved in cell wall biosynthesis
LKNNKKTITILCPVYNEESSINPFYASLSNELKKIKKMTFEILFVDDGSIDNSAGQVKKIMSKDKRIKLIQLSRNFGKESALTAGIDYATGNALIPIDVDLQDPPELIKKMVEKWENGFEVILAKRSDRSSDSKFKRKTANWFYSTFNFLSKTKIPQDVGDFRLIDRSVIDALKKLPESERFMKGLFAWVGFKTTLIPYVRNTRNEGETKFRFWGLINLAADGITNFSAMPLKIWSYVGIIISLLSLVYGSTIAFRTIIYGINVPGYSSIFFAITFLGGIQLIGLGILGEYVSRTFIESKRRPSYIIRKIYH